MKSIYVFSDEKDAFVSAVARHLEDHLAVRSVTPQQASALLSAPEQDVRILDVSRDLDEPAISTPSLSMREIVTEHDLEIALFLRLMQDNGMSKSVSVIGIPAEGDAKAIARQVLALAREEKEGTGA